MKQIKDKITREGNIIKVFTNDHIENAENTILFIGVVHGDEPEGEELIIKQIEKIKNNLQEFSKNKLIFIPCLNPDGKELGTRTNANGVDLNRNFPTKNWEKSPIKDRYYSGDAPASEIETNFLIKLIEEEKPDIIVTLHTPFKIVNFDGPAEKIAQKVSELTGYPSQNDIGYPTPGSFGTYCGVERNIPTLTIEMPDDTCINTLWEQMEQAFDYLCGIK